LKPATSQNFSRFIALFDNQMGSKEPRTKGEQEMSSSEAFSPIDDVSLGQQIGIAFFYWQGVEQQATELFRILLAPTEERSADITFHALKGFSVRLELLNEIALCQLHQTSLAVDWTAVYEGFKKSLSNRHDLGHLSYRLNFVRRNGYRHFRGPIFNAQTTTTDRLRLSSDAKAEINARLFTTTSEFSALVVQIEVFKLKLVAWKCADSKILNN
jgi:hypothetical protein